MHHAECSKVLLGLGIKCFIFQIYLKQESLKFAADEYTHDVDRQLMPVGRQLPSFIKPRPPPAPAIAAAVSSTAFGSTTAALLLSTGYFAS